MYAHNKVYSRYSRYSRYSTSSILDVEILISLMSLKILISLMSLKILIINHLSLCKHGYIHLCVKAAHCLCNFGSLTIKARAASSSVLIKCRIENGMEVIVWILWTWLPIELSMTLHSSRYNTLRMHAATGRVGNIGVLEWGGISCSGRKELEGSTYTNKCALRVLYLHKRSTSSTCTNKCALLALLTQTRPKGHWESCNHTNKTALLHFQTSGR